MVGADGNTSRGRPDGGSGAAQWVCCCGPQKQLYGPSAFVIPCSRSLSFA